ncbi:Molybdopterin-binding protein [Halogranum rubrum]|uniref:Molybdopterin-binding protein n=1 Tax=Halogranum rubrum TaxID=553466 RepID=A0A1I4CVL0_9EURY|nr:TOBE domain-containing protein [Halogranum rubrum]SFK85328.1 Molybdopterin-binding protein [Halogranum rubrum]
MSAHPYNRLSGIVRSVVQAGTVAHVVLEGSDGDLFTTQLTAAAADRLRLVPGDELEATMHVAEVAVNGRRAQPVVRTHTPARGMQAVGGLDDSSGDDGTIV